MVFVELTQLCTKLCSSIFLLLTAVYHETFSIAVVNMGYLGCLEHVV